MKPETSKIITLVNYIIGILLLVATVIMVFLGKDTMIMGTIAGLVWAEIGVSNAFYFNKAKRENIIKISIGMLNELPEGTDPAKINAISCLMEAGGG